MANNTDDLAAEIYKIIDNFVSKISELKNALETLEDIKFPNKALSNKLDNLIAKKISEYDESRNKPLAGEIQTDSGASAPAQGTGSDIEKITRRGKLKEIRDEKNKDIKEAKASGLTGTALDEKIQKIKDYAKLKKEAVNEVLGKDPLADWLGNNYDKLANQIASGLTEISSLFMKNSKEMADRDKKMAKERYDNRLKEINDELNAELVKNGYVVENNAESLRMQLEAAKRTGDEVLIYEAERALQKQQIEDQAAADKEKAERELKNKEADINYDYNLQQWNWNLAMGYVNAAAAVLQAWKSAPFPANLLTVGITIAKTTAELAAITDAKPTPPTKFATGGIVPGISFTGDRVPALLNSGELILNRSQQENLFDQINNNELGEGKKIYITTVIELDGTAIAEKVFQVGSMGNSFIRARGVVR